MKVYCGICKQEFDRNHIHPEPNTFKVEVIADSSGQWCGNGLGFETREQAEAYALDLAMRWTAVRDWRVVLSTEVK